MKTKFSELLTLLMKERKISGQKIADLVGKSQKTISRYATGEIDPTEEMKKNILNAISTISGIDVEKDWINIDMASFYDDLGIETFDPDGAEVQMARACEENDRQNIDFLIQEFSKMTDQAETYYLQNFEHFMRIKEWEMYVLDFFHSLEVKKQEDLLKFLEHFTITYDRALPADKLASYMHMISASENRPSILYRNDSEEKNLSDQKIAEFKDKLSDLYCHNFPFDSSDYLSDGTSLMNFSIVPTYEYVTYSPFDWYLLLRIQIFEMYERLFDNVFWCEEYPVVLGQKLYGLLESYR